ncbi:MAG: Mce-associated rane protein [Mycobacterium sp.]|jgi:Mce-associated membrane protein|nr:Mce-associated rane protein [Mycobacterium sp.]
MRVELADSATDQDEASVAEENTEQVDDEVDETEEAGDDGQDAVDVEDVAETDDTSSDEANKQEARGAKLRARMRGLKWSRVIAFGVLPVLAVLAAAAAGIFYWQNTQNRGSSAAGIESVAAAKDSTAAILSYQPDRVEKDLDAAGDRLTGKFKDSYTQLTHDVVIPGAKKEHISAIATVPAAASVSATPNHAVVLVYVNQTVTVGNDVPSDTASAVRVTLDKSGDRWLISAFDPI